MHVLVVTNVFDPDRAGGAAVFSDLCYGLRGAGHDVTVYCAHPYYPEWRRKTDASPWSVYRDDRNGVRVLRHGLRLPSDPSSIRGRILYEASFAVSLMRSLLRDRSVDVIVAFCPLVSSVGFAVMRRTILRRPLWVNVQDIPIDAARGAGIAEQRETRRMGLSEYLQSRLLKNASAITTICPPMANRIDELLGTSNRVKVFPNWLHLSLAKLLTPVGDEGANVKVGPLRLLYAGNIGMKQALLDFCRELAQDSETPFEMHIYGDGAAMTELREWIRVTNDSRFHIGPFLEEAAFAEELRRCDYFVITERSGAGASFLPSKLIPALAAGRPILAYCDAGSPLGLEVSQHALGLRVSRGQLADAVRLASMTRASLTDYELVRARCRRHLTLNYDRGEALMNCEALLQSLVHTRSTRPSEQP